jgi:hypothetical protein
MIVTGSSGNMTVVSCVDAGYRAGWGMLICLCKTAFEMIAFSLKSTATSIYE